MSQSQPWPLSQKAAKQSGVCSICFATRQIHLKDGTLHLHGPRHKPCPGSNLPPIGNAPTGQGSQIQPDAQLGLAGSQSTAQLNAVILSTSETTTPLASISTLSSTADTSRANGPAQPSVSHPADRGPIIKHIPRSARQHIAAELSSVLSHICSNPADVSNWSTLLEFGSVMLHAPPRAGRRHNLASVLNKRSILTTDPSSPLMEADRRTHRRVSSDQSLATAVMSKIEDGNIKAAIRIITSGESPAVDNAQTYQSVCDRHPHAPVDRIPSPDPSKFPAAQFTEDVTATIRSFPTGSAGGPDGVRPQHLRDLTTNKETGPALVTSLTAFINLLMQGKCPSSVTPIFFGGRLFALQKKLGGIRPIAIGYSLRRLAAKCVNKYALNVLKDTFIPSQLGVGISGGCEAAIHATRRFLENMRLIIS